MAEDTKKRCDICYQRCICRQQLTVKHYTHWICDACVLDLEHIINTMNLVATRAWVDKKPVN